MSLYLHVIRLRPKFRINRTIWRRDRAEKRFSIGRHCPLSWICCDVIMTVYPGTAFYVLDIVLNFHDDRFCIFLKYVNFHVSAIWLKNFENRPSFRKLMDNTMMATFYYSRGTQ